jgi:hypothetical protein
MIEGLIALLIVCLVVAVIAAVILYCVSLIPIDPPFQQIVRILVVTIAALIIILKALPLLGVSI